MSQKWDEPADEGRRSMSVERSRKLLPLAATIDDRLKLLSSIGEDERVLGRYRDAEATLRAAADLAGDIGDQRALAGILISLAATVQHLNRTDEALALFGEAIALCERLPNLTDVRGTALQSYGVCLAELGRRAEARQAISDALELRRASGNRALIASAERALQALGN